MVRVHQVPFFKVFFRKTMVILKTTCESSFTGKYLYSDTYAEIPGCRAPKGKPEITIMPTLNKGAAIPFFGHVAATGRIALAIIHIAGHTFAAIIFWDMGHLCHVAKGGAELLRGLIEITPIVGRIFVWNYDSRDPLCSHKCSEETGYYSSYFLIKIYNPDQPDLIDHHLAQKGKHPYLQKV